MQKLFFYLSIVLLAQSCAVSKNYSPEKKYPRQQLQQDYALLQNILETKHPSLYWYTSKDSMDYFFNKYHAAIEDSMTEQQFGWKILAPLTRHIHCGHTSFYMSKGYGKWATGKTLPAMPLFMRVWKDTIVVTANQNRKDSILKRGTVIASINGMESRRLIDSMFTFFTEDGYSHNINYSRLSNNFPNLHRNIFGLSKQYEIGYKDSSGNIRHTTIPLVIPTKDTTRRKEPSVKAPRPTKKQRMEAFRSMSVDSSINTAIITLNSFTKGKLRKFFRQSFRQIKQDNIKNVVLDLRSNGGGKINLSTLLTKYVSRKPFKVADSAYTVSKFISPYTKYIKGKILNNLGMIFFTKKRKDGLYHFGYWERKYFKPKTTNHFDGNLYVLTTGQTFSASSLFCNVVKGQPGITLVGEETGGGWHGNTGILIPDITLPNTRLRVRLPLFRLVQYNHVPKNGQGVMPDVLVPPNYDALIKGYDKKLQVAKEMIKNNSR